MKLNETLVKIIMYRDGNRCRAKCCNNKGERVYPLSEKQIVLDGKFPHMLVTFCGPCYEEVTTDLKGKPLSRQRSIYLAMRKVINASFFPGKSEPRIGRWFRDQFKANLSTQELIKKECHV